MSDNTIGKTLPKNNKYGGKAHGRNPLDDRKRREIDIAEERKRQEETLEKLLSSLRDPARTRGIDPGTSVDSGVGRLQLNRLTEGDDIEAYLTTFER